CDNVSQLYLETRCSAERAVVIVRTTDAKFMATPPSDGDVLIAEQAIAHSGTCLQIELARAWSDLPDTRDRGLVEMEDFTGAQRELDTAVPGRSPPGEILSG